MKNTALLILSLAFVCAGAVSCGGDNGDGNSIDSACFADVCADDGKTLVKCDAQTRRARLVYCQNSCENGACIGEAAVKCDQSVCLDAQTLNVCDAETGALSAKTCPEGCENGACKETNLNKCAQSTCLDAQTLNVCDAKTGVLTPQTCLKGCENGACKETAAVKCTQNKCLDAQTLNVCDAQTGTFSPIGCPYGCENGACLAAQAKYCTQNADCADEPGSACVANRCVASPENPADALIGTACGSDFEGFCDDQNNAAVYCSAKGFVRRTACADGKICLVSKTSAIADCYESDISKDAASCNAVGAQSDICDDMDYASAAYVTKRQCEELSDGTKRYVRSGLQRCAYACNELNTACAAVSDDGKTCSADAVAYCKNRGEPNCAVYNEGVVCYADADACGETGKKASYCAQSYGGEPMSVQTLCVLAADGVTKLSLETGRDYCALSCDSATNRCAAVSDDGKTCNAAATQYCARLYDGCAVVGGQMQCYFDGDKCGEEGAETVSCDDFEADADIYVSVTQTCMTADDGTTMINVDTGYEYCDTMCSSISGECLAAAADGGECSEGHSALCAKHGHAGCALIGGDPVCYDGDCENEGEISVLCAEGADKTAQTTTKACAKTDKNALVTISATQNCANGCNDGKTACKDEI